MNDGMTALTKGTTALISGTRRLDNGNGMRLICGTRRLI